MIKPVGGGSGFNGLRQMLVESLIDTRFTVGQLNKPYFRSAAVESIRRFDSSINSLFLSYERSAASRSGG